MRCFCGLTSVVEKFPWVRGVVIGIAIFAAIAILATIVLSIWDFIEKNR